MGGRVSRLQQDKSGVEGKREGRGLDEGTSGHGTWMNDGEEEEGSEGMWYRGRAEKERKGKGESVP